MQIKGDVEQGQIMIAVFIVLLGINNKKKKDKSWLGLIRPLANMRRQTHNSMQIKLNQIKSKVGSD